MYSNLRNENFRTLLLTNTLIVFFKSNILNFMIIRFEAVPIWLEYIQFSIGGMGEENGIENIRSICEKACSFAGLHVTKGYLLWEAYREFETAILAGYQV